MQYRITYPMEAGAFIRAMEEETGKPRDAVTVDLAVAIAIKINKAYYRGKFGRGQAPDRDAAVVRARRYIERGEIDAAEFFALLYRHEADAFDAGRRESIRRGANR